MDIPLLPEITIIFGLSIGVLLFCHRLRMPLIVGFLFTGLLCGPQGLGFVDDVKSVQMLAEIGIVLLLFTVGMEFSIKKIMQFRRFFFVGGLLQVVLTTLGGFLVGQLFDRPMGESLFLGFLLALSSTTIVMRILDERSEIGSPHGRLILGTLIFQDVAVVPMMLLVPVLAGADDVIDPSFLFALGEGILILVVAFVVAERIVPTLLFHVARTGSRELFLLSVLVICFSVAWLASRVGLSLSLGAFLAGLIVSESEYSNKAIGDILPFRDIFTSFFFVSIGMLLNLGFLIEHPFTILFIALGVFILKSTVAGITGIAVGMPLRTTVLSALALSQVGEFSFVLAQAGIDLNIATEQHYQLFLAVTVITMALTPAMINYSPKIANWAMQLPVPTQLKTGLKPIKVEPEHRDENHVIIIGLGLAGKNLARSTQEAGIPYVILEMDADIVKQERKCGEPIHFGDATHENVLRHANIAQAKAVAVLINDPVASLRIVELVKRMNPAVYLIVRTRYHDEMKPMFQLGADDVIVDEFGSSVEIFTRVLQKYDVTRDRIEGFIEDLRMEGYEMLRLKYQEPTLFSTLDKEFGEVSTGTFVLSRRSLLANKTLGEAQLRKAHGLSLVLIKRKSETFSNLDAETELLPNDVLVVVGTDEDLKKAEKLFSLS